MPETPPTRRFARTVEDFVCEKCGTRIAGDGYTNHCPHCLWSRHVDVNPGDRKATCKGMMEPVAVVAEGGEYWIVHRCTHCRFERRNRAASEDDFDLLVSLSVGRPPRHL